TVNDDVIEALADRGTKLVLVARPPIGDMDSVNAENRSSATELTRHLLANGVRRLTFVGDPDSSPDVAERWQGIWEAVDASEHDVAIELATVYDLDETTGAAIAEEALERGDLPDAFACANDELALGLLGRLRAAGVDVPGTVKVTGWDDVMAARYAGLTTVRQPMRELGATAARLLDARIAGRRTVQARQELLPTRLVVRTSCAHHE
ncbi:MAG: LacI family DNA-binding transcriptional regulator, partial [Nocardioidaceae bacterium]